MGDGRASGGTLRGGVSVHPGPMSGRSGIGWRTVWRSGWGESCCWIENGLGVAVAISVLKNLELRELNHAGRTETASGWFGPPWLL
jgi:hypothetical protein